MGLNSVEDTICAEFFMSQVRLSFEGTNAVELAEILKGFPGCEVAVQVLDGEVVRGIDHKEIRKVIVTVSLAVGLLGTGAGAVKTSAEAVKTSAEAGSAVIEFVQKLQEFQAGSKKVEKIVVIPAEGDRINLTNSSGEALVKAIEAEL
jgi:hypothetical protein